MFPNIKFYAEQGRSCCGQITFFDLWPVAHGGYAKKFETVEEQAQNLQEQFDKQIEDETKNWNEDEEYDDAEQLACVYGFATMTLIDDQFPGLIDALVKNHGWEVSHRVVNPKTKNTINHMVKVLGESVDQQEHNGLATL